MFHNKAAWLALFLSAAVSVTGCSGYESNKGSTASNSNMDVDGDIDTKALDADIDEVEASIAEFQSQMHKIDVPLAGLSAQNVSSKGLDSGVRKVLDKVLEAATKVFTNIDKLEAEVREKMAKLDPTNPLHVVALIKLNEALTYLTQVKVKIGDQFRALITKVDALLAAVDAKVAKIDPKNPLSIIAAIAWATIKNTVLEYRTKLLALLP